MERLACSAPLEDEAEPLRARARAALRGAVEPVAGEVVETQACDSCGRIEAPQRCIGVCIRPETLMVEAAEHAAVHAQAIETQRALERLVPPVRRLAWARPQPGRWDATARALSSSVKQDGLDKCDPRQLVGYQGGGQWSRASNNAVRYTRAVEAFGVNLTARSGFSKDVTLGYEWGGATGKRHYLCGRDGKQSPFESGRVFSGARK